MIGVVALLLAGQLDVAVRADPIVFALGGFSVGADVALTDRAGGVRAAVAAFHVEVPALLVPVVAQPSAGLRVVEDAVQLGARVDLGHGLWAGPELYAYQLTYSLDEARGVGRELYAHATAGWRWSVVPRVFLEPWVTLGLPVFGTGGADVGGVTVRDRPLNWHATVSVGVDVW